MISLVHIVKQKQTRKRESDRLGGQSINVQSCQAKRAVVPKRLIRLLGRCPLLNILRTFFSEHFHGRPQSNILKLPYIKLPLLPGITGYCNSRNRCTIVAL